MVHLAGKVGTGPVQHAIITLPNVGPKGEFHKEMGGAIYPPRRGAPVVLVMALRSGWAGVCGMVLISGLDAAQPLWDTRCKMAAAGLAGMLQMSSTAPLRNIVQQVCDHVTAGIKACCTRVDTG
jgi:hypothetical protein